MRCLKPRLVGYNYDGSICWNTTKAIRDRPLFQLPCSKCIECRLEYARQWAVRCVHEAQMHQDNSFITLTYSDDNLKSDRLIYSDFQNFMKRLRYYNPDKKISAFITGEYGEKTKRPHWHALLFNYRPTDLVYKRTSDRGTDKLYNSKLLEQLWGKGTTETGQVTFESAGYCARYASKKLIHGHDQAHNFHPISKKSSKYAIGRSYLEKYYTDIFNHGECFIINAEGKAQGVPIPRYYEKWLAQHKPQAWLEYLDVKLKRQLNAELKAKKINDKYLSNWKNAPYGTSLPQNPNKARETIINQKFKQLQKHLKGDI